MAKARQLSRLRVVCAMTGHKTQARLMMQKNLFIGFNNDIYPYKQSCP